jgi:hypothetical protein
MSYIRSHRGRKRSGRIRGGQQEQRRRYIWDDDPARLRSARRLYIGTISTISFSIYHILLDHQQLPARKLGSIHAVSIWRFNKTRSSWNYIYSKLFHFTRNWRESSASSICSFYCVYSSFYKIDTRRNIPGEYVLYYTHYYLGFAFDALDGVIGRCAISWGVNGDADSRTHGPIFVHHVPSCNNQMIHSFIIMIRHLFIYFVPFDGPNISIYALLCSPRRCCCSPIIWCRTYLINFFLSFSISSPWQSPAYLTYFSKSNEEKKVFGISVRFFSNLIARLSSTKGIHHVSLGT